MGTGSSLITTRGELDRTDLGLVLPHEHVFVELGDEVATHHQDVDPADVVAVMSPYVEDAMAAGVTAMVECTPEGVGRRVDVLEAVSDATNLPVVAPTGIYREPWVPQWAREASEEDLFEWLLGELTEAAAGADTRAAWIKVSAGDDGLTAVEEKILRAAARAGAETGALIGSHTVDADVVERQLDVVADAGYRPERFLWIHAQAEADVERHLAVAERGAWIEYDWIGDPEENPYYVDLVERVLEAGLEDRLLLSQDNGWYDPSEPGGGEQTPYTQFTDTFLPALREAVPEETVEALTRDNPYRAFSR